MDYKELKNFITDTNNNEKEVNKKLTERYPFLIPKNIYTLKVPENYDYQYCLFKDEIPEGWWKRWGLEFLEDLNNVLVKHSFVDDLLIMQVKEKYGGLRFYTGGMPEEWYSHEHAWEYISEHTCVKCGKFPVPMRYFSWWSPYCDQHAWEGENCSEEEKTEITEESWDGRVQEFIVMNHYIKDGDYQEWIDMKPYYDLIGYKYTKEDLISNEEIEEIIRGKKDGKV